MIPRTNVKILISALSLVVVAGLSGCGGGVYFADSSKLKPVTVTLVHINDHHSQLAPFDNAEFLLDGTVTRAELGGFARVTQAFKAYAGRSDVLSLHAGDATTGTLYHTLFQGEADAAMMNGVCFDALAVGNHEFDDGDAGLRRFIDALHSGACRTPVLAANIVPATGTPLAPSARDYSLQPYVIRSVDGVRLAIIGLTAKDKTRHSSRPLDSTMFEDETIAAQRTIDRLKAEGLRHFVLLTHQGLEADKALAARLSDEDVIVGGDSHSLLGDFSALGLSASGSYPTVLANRDGRPVCVVQAWEYGKAIGELNVTFNAQGEVENCTGQASLLLGSDFKRKDANGAFVAVEAAERQRIIDSLAKMTSVRVVEPDVDAVERLAGYSRQVTDKMAETIGRIESPLCMVRVPGESTNRSGGVAGCETANTLARGSDIAQVVAEAFLAASPMAEVAIQNAGGVRIALPAGTVSMSAAFSLLPFANVLVELRLNGMELRQALEDAVSNHLDRGESTGSHPYAAGLRWNLDMTRPKGARFSNVEMRDRASGRWLPLDPERIYTVVTSDFLASGKDGYAVFGAASARGDATPSYLLYTQSFVDYVRSRQVLDRPGREDRSHQSVITAEGTRLP